MWGFYFAFVGHTRQCSGLTASSVFRDQSWCGSQYRMQCWNQTWVRCKKIMHITCCTNSLVHRRCVDFITKSMWGFSLSVTANYPFECRRWPWLLMTSSCNSCSCLISEKWRAAFPDLYFPSPFNGFVNIIFWN